MMVSCSRPWAFWGILLLVPVLLMVVLWYRRVRRANVGSVATLSRIRFVLPARTLCWSLAWISLLVALSGLSWGTQLVPVQQTGSSLSLVFDISWSMTAQDVGAGKDRSISRLEAAASYAQSLLDHLDTTDVSVIIAKGEGVVAIPLTRDFNAIRSLLPALSPRLMTTTGTSLGSGVRTAASSFPLLSVSKRTVVVLTDGEETDGTLERETEQLVASGIDVVFLGFGTTVGAEILAGDGKTVVHSFLQEESLRHLVDSVNQSVSASEVGRSGGTKALYLSAQSLGSAHRVLDVVTAGQQGKEWSGTAYQVGRSQRWNIFALLAMVFLCVGFVLEELEPATLRRLFRLRGAGKNLMVLLLMSWGFFFQGCSKAWQGAAGVLEGTFFWHQGEYQKAVSGFMDSMAVAEALSDDTLHQYSIYGLASTYIMQGETEAALSRLQEVSPGAPESLWFAALYNSGIIAYNQGQYQEAATLFRRALEVDGSNLDAKINLELSLGHDSRQSTAAAQELIPVQETPGDDFADAALFSLIRQQEQDRWKNQQDETATPTGDDY